MSLRTPAEVTALTLLDRDGIAAIWGLHVSAASAYRHGRKVVAALIIGMAAPGRDASAQQLAELASLIPCIRGGAAASIPSSTSSIGWTRDHSAILEHEPCV